MASEIQDLVKKLEESNLKDLVNELQLSYRYNHALSEIGNDILTRSSDAQSAKVSGAFDLIAYSHMREEIRNSSLYNLARQGINERFNCGVSYDWVGWLGVPQNIREELPHLIKILAKAEIYKETAIMYCPTEREVVLTKKFLEGVGLRGIFIRTKDIESKFIKGYENRKENPCYWHEIHGISDVAAKEMDDAFKILNPHLGNSKI